FSFKINIMHVCLTVILHKSMSGIRQGPSIIESSNRINRGTYRSITCVQVFQIRIGKEIGWIFAPLTPLTIDITWQVCTHVEFAPWQIAGDCYEWRENNIPDHLNLDFFLERHITMPAGACAITIHRFDAVMMFTQT